MKLREQTARILTGIVGIPVVLLMLWLGGWWWRVTLLVLAWAGQLELYRMYRLRGYRPLYVAGLLLGGLIFVQDVWSLWLPLSLLVFLGMLVYVLFKESSDPLVDTAGTVLGAIYPAYLFFLLYRIRMPSAEAQTQDFWISVLLFVLVWSVDIGAYYVGRAFGRHKLFPRVSPGKTWEGAIGGLLAAWLIGSLFRWGWMPFMTWTEVWVMALLIGVAGPLGDLVESRFKRAVGIKDSGHILPGHGGVLDRFDAMLFVAPLAYLFIRYCTELWV